MTAHDQVIRKHLARQLRHGERIIGAALVRNEPRAGARIAQYHAMPSELVAYLVLTTQRILVVRTTLTSFGELPRPECGELVHELELRDVERVEQRGAFGGKQLDLYLRGTAAPLGLVLWDRCDELAHHAAIAAGFVSWFAEQRDSDFAEVGSASIHGPFDEAPEVAAEPWGRPSLSGPIALLIALAVLGVAAGGIAWYLVERAKRPPPPPVVATPPPVVAMVDGGAPPSDGGVPLVVDAGPAPPPPPPPPPPPAVTAEGLGALDATTAASRIASTGWRIRSSRHDEYLSVASELVLDLEQEPGSEYGTATLLDFGAPGLAAASRVGPRRALAVNGGDRQAQERFVEELDGGGCDDNTSCLALLRRLPTTSMRGDDDDEAPVLGYRTFLLFAEIRDQSHAIYVVDYAGATRPESPDAVVVDAKRVLIVSTTAEDKVHARGIASALAGRR